MPAILNDHIPIRAVKTVSGQSPQTNSIKEKSAQTFKSGTPVMLSSGVVKEWDATVGAASATVGIAGITLGDGANLATDGAGAPAPFEGVGAPGASLTYGSVPNQTAAVNIPRGAPFSDGRTIFEVANEDTIFEAQFDDTAGAAYTTNANQVGKKYGLTKDATGHWYVDAAKTTAGTDTVVTVVALHPNDGAVANGRLWVKFDKDHSQLVGS